MQAVHSDHGAAEATGSNESSAHAGSDGHAEENGVVDTTMATVVTVGAVGVAAIVFEAALIPGIVLGVAAALVPGYAPRFGAALNPILRSGVRSAFKLGHKTREVMSEAREHIHDLAAEVEAEKDIAASTMQNAKVNGTAKA